MYNNSLIGKILNEPNDQSMVEPNDVEQAQLIIDYYKNKLLSILSGQANAYTINAAKVANEEFIMSNDSLSLGIVASLPKAYREGTRFDSMIDDLAHAKEIGCHYGTVGSIYNGDVKVIHTFYSKNWFTNYITGIDSDNHVINFQNKEPIDVGTTVNIRGRVKELATGNVTRLNYVKVTVDNVN